MRDSLKLIILFLVLLSIPISLSSEIDVEVDDEVFEELEQEETVDVIVILEDDAALEIDKEIKIVNKDSSDENEIISEEIAVEGEFEIINGFSAEITEEGLDALEDNPNVKEVQIDEIKQLLLSDSVPLINASETHAIQISGINLTGIGQSICIIDTGVNYSHVDLGGCFGDGCKVISGYDYVNNDDDPMDDNGHGTHVAGIVAAQGAVVGVAPEASIVALKACDNDGCLNSKIISSMEWCINNASEFNISVISMSLGSTTLYGSYCDSEDAALAELVDNAISQNISVVVATGNDGSSTGIGSPACITNSTRVGASDKSDNLASFTNRDSSFIDMLLAPGDDILSTYAVGANYAYGDGTSMSAPHVSGAVAIMQQYAQTFENINLTFSEVEQVLNDTGVQIYDTSTGLYFSRINIYEAIDYIRYPQINLVNVANASAFNPGILNFTVSTISGVSSAWYNNGTDNATADNTSISDWYINMTDGETGEWNLTLYANDSANVIGNKSYTFYVDYAPNITAWAWNTTWDGSEVNSSNSTETLVNVSGKDNSTIQFNITVSDTDNLNSITYGWYIDSVLKNDTVNWTYEVSTDDSGYHNLTLNVSDNYLDTLFSWNLTIEDPYTHNWTTDLLPNSSSGETAWSYDLFSKINNTDGDNLTYTCSPYSCSNGTLSNTFECSDSGSYDIYVNVSDGWNQLEGSFTLAVSDTVTCSSSSSGGSGGGGGGGSSAASTSAQVSRIFNLVKVGEAQSLIVSNDQIPASKIDFSLNLDNRNVILSVKKLEEKPVDVVEPAGVKHSYLEIGLTNFVGEVTDADIEFKVAKTWVLDNNIDLDTVHLVRYTTSWHELQTEKIGETSTEYQFSAESPGFSYFAIVGDTKIVASDSIEIEISKDEPQNPLYELDEKLTTKNKYILLILFVVTILVLIFHIKSQPFKIAHFFEGETHKHHKIRKNKQK
jgi:PGF-pre-PGF domain-containing protein